MADGAAVQGAAEAACWRWSLLRERRWKTDGWWLPRGAWLAAALASSGVGRSEHDGAPSMRVRSAVPSAAARAARAACCSAMSFRSAGVAGAWRDRCASAVIRAASVATSVEAAAEEARIMSRTGRAELSDSCGAGRSATSRGAGRVCLAALYAPPCTSCGAVLDVPCSAGASRAA